MSDKTQTTIAIIFALGFALGMLQLGDGLKGIGKGIKAIADAWREATLEQKRINDRILNRRKESEGQNEQK
jgi:hypothetical protein